MLLPKGNGDEWTVFLETQTAFLALNIVQDISPLSQLVLEWQLHLLEGL
jgi:hypothetical protein